MQIDFNDENKTENNQLLELKYSKVIFFSGRKLIVKKEEEKQTGTRNELMIMLSWMMTWRN